MPFFSTAKPDRSFFGSPGGKCYQALPTELGPDCLLVPLSSIHKESSGKWGGNCRCEVTLVMGKSLQVPWEAWGLVGMLWSPSWKAWQKAAREPQTYFCEVAWPWSNDSIVRTSVSPDVKWKLVTLTGVWDLLSQAYYDIENHQMYIRKKMHFTRILSECGTGSLPTPQLTCPPKSSPRKVPRQRGPWDLPYTMRIRSMRRKEPASNPASSATANHIAGFPAGGRADPRSLLAVINWLPDS